MTLLCVFIVHHFLQLDLTTFLISWIYIYMHTAVSSVWVNCELPDVSPSKNQESLWCNIHVTNLVFWISAAGTIYPAPSPGSEVEGGWRRLGGGWGGLRLFTSLWHVCGCFHGDGSKDSWDVSEMQCVPRGADCWTWVEGWAEAHRKWEEPGAGVPGTWGRDQSRTPDECSHRFVYPITLNGMWHFPAVPDVTGLNNKVKLQLNKWMSLCLVSE